MWTELAAIIKFSEASICRFLIPLFARHRSSKFISPLISITVSTLLLRFYCFIWVLILVYIKVAAFLFYYICTFPLLLESCNQKRLAFIAVVCDQCYPTKHTVRLERSIFMVSGLCCNRWIGKLYSFWSVASTRFFGSESPAFSLLCSIAWSVERAVQCFSYFVVNILISWSGNTIISQLWSMY